MNTLSKDLRYGIRALARTPAFTLIAVATLALAIGSTSSLFSVFNGVLLRPLPYRNPERLVQVWATDPQQINNRHSPGDYLDLKKQTRSFEIIAGYEEQSFELSGHGEPRRVRGVEVTSDFFEVFGVPASIGRTLNSREDGAGSPRHAVVSDAVWKREFGGSPSILGQSLRVNGEDDVVVGVLPASFDWPAGAEMWSTGRELVPASPIALEGDHLQNRELQYFDAVARLAPKASIAGAEAELAAIAKDLQSRYPQTNRGRAWRLVTLQQQLVGDVRQALTVLLAAILCVWLVACANIATLMLARASRRQREMAIRAALGASRGRLIQQLLAEGLLLAAAGGAAGLGVALAGTKLLLRFAPPDIPRLAEVALDGRATLVALALSLAAGLLFGLTPSLPAHRRSLSPTLTFGARATGGGGPSLLRVSLVAGELAFALILLSGAGLLVNSLLRLTRVDPGFSAQGLVAVSVPLPDTRYPDARRQAQFYAELLRRLREAPEIASVATVYPIPLAGGGATANVEPREFPRDVDGPICELASISPDYFRTLGIPLRRGRLFDARDTAEAPRVAIVSDSLVARLWPGSDPIGREVRIGTGPGAEAATIVGVAPDVRVRRLADAPPPALYIPVDQFVLPLLSVVARGSGDAAPVLAAVRREAQKIDPELPVGEARPFERIVEESVAAPRFRTWLLAAFSAAALALASLGVYGIASTSVAARTRELGVRIALGASPSQVRRLVLGEGLKLTAIGAGMGLAGAIALTRLLRSLLFGVDATDVPTLLAVSLILGAAVLVAIFLPARRAARVDPVTALKGD